jgi:putative Holliday junction resolvase
VGEKRIGLALGDSDTKIAVPAGFIKNDANTAKEIEQIIYSKQPNKLIIGLPRNSSGQETKQSSYVRQFAAGLTKFDLPIVFQDESLTSVEAEKHLADLTRKQPKRPDKGEVDARAAALILSDFLESNYGRE